MNKDEMEKIVNKVPQGSKFQRRLNRESKAIKIVCCIVALLSFVVTNSTKGFGIESLLITLVVTLCVALVLVLILGIYNVFAR